MAQMDYLLRQIEILGQLLIAIRKMIMGGEADGAAVETRLREVAGKGGMELELARAATPDTLRMLIAPTGEIEPGRCWLLAETLYLDGIQARLTEDYERASDSLRKARICRSPTRSTRTDLASVRSRNSLNCARSVAYASMVFGERPRSALR